VSATQKHKSQALSQSSPYVQKWQKGGGCALKEIENEA